VTVQNKSVEQDGKEKKRSKRCKKKKVEKKQKGGDGGQYSKKKGTIAKGQTRINLSEKELVKKKGKDVGTEGENRG